MGTLFIVVLAIAVLGVLVYHFTSKAPTIKTPPGPWTETKDPNA